MSEETSSCTCNTGVGDEGRLGHRCELFMDEALWRTLSRRDLQRPRTSPSSLTPLSSWRARRFPSSAISRSFLMCQARLLSHSWPRSAGKRKFPSVPWLYCIHGAFLLCHVLLRRGMKISRELALPLLYRDVSLDSESAVRQYCRTIENDPALALLVKSFSIASSATPQDLSSNHHDFLAGVHYALKSMVSLTDLRIRLVEQPPYQQRHW